MFTCCPYNMAIEWFISNSGARRYWSIVFRQFIAGIRIGVTGTTIHLTTAFDDNTRYCLLHMVFRYYKWVMRWQWLDISIMDEITLLLFITGAWYNENIKAFLKSKHYFLSKLSIHQHLYNHIMYSFLFNKSSNMFLNQFYLRAFAHDDFNALWTRVCIVSI